MKMIWKTICPPAAWLCLVSCFIILLNAGTVARAQDDEHADNTHANHQEQQSALSFQVPGTGWKRSAGTDGSKWVMFESEDHPGTSFSLQSWNLPPDVGSLAQLCDFELNHWRQSGQVNERSRTERTVAGQEALALCFVRDQDGRTQIVDVTYMIRNGSVYRVSVAVAQDDEDSLPDLLADTLAGIQWTQQEARQPEAVITTPIEITDPIAGNVLTIIHAAGSDAVVQYLEALPGAARTNDGIPVVLIVGHQLTPTARDFIQKYRPEHIRLIGKKLPELPQAQAATDPWQHSDNVDTVVVAHRDLSYAVPAAALAIQQNVPLIIENESLADRLHQLKPRHCIAVGPVDLPSNLAHVERLADALAVADRVTGASYIALCNTADGAGAETAVFAAALAGIHNGVVLPINEPVRTHQAALKPTTRRPAGFDDPSTQNWITGTWTVDGKELNIAAAVTGDICISGVKSDRYSRPRIDLNNDGRFDADTETISVGSTIDMFDRPAAFTVRYQTAFGQPGQGEALLIQPDPNDIRRTIRSLVARMGSEAEHLAIVGVPPRIPFAILESQSYFTSLDIKQELVGDAPYADLDDDPSLELAVGRVLVPDLERGSAILATSLAYPRMQGEWARKAAILAPGFAGAEGKNSLFWVWPESESLARSVDGELRLAGIESSTFLRDNADMPDVIAAMQHAGWIGHMNHSNETTWGIRPGSHITSADLPALFGSPIVIDTGCSSGGVDRQIPFSSTMPGRFLELGAVAYLGNARPASLGTEAAVQQMVNRLISDGATIGQAYRDGRNLLAHLLTLGHVNPEFGNWVFDPGVYDRTWAQFYNLNLFADPALCAQRPDVPAAPPVEVTLEETSQPDCRRLTITRRAPQRVDPLLIMPEAGQGTAREALLITAPGLSYGMVPHFYLDRDGTSPLDTPLSTAPGAWVDVELPVTFTDVVLTQVEGPTWADRGYSVETDPGRPPHLRAYVPLVHSNLAEGNGEVLDRVSFDVRATDTGDADSPGTIHTNRNYRQAEHATPRPFRLARITDAARPAVDAMQTVQYDPWDAGLAHLNFTVDNPGSTILEQARCNYAIQKGGTLQCDVQNLPQRFAAHEDSIRNAFAFVYDFVSNDPLAFLLSGDYAVDVHVSNESETALRLVPIDDNPGDEVALVMLSQDNLVQSIRRRRFGVEEETHFQWAQTPDGYLISRLVTDNVRYGQPHVIEIEYSNTDNTRVHRPSRISISVPGLLARPFVFIPRYDEAGPLAAN